MTYVSLARKVQNAVRLSEVMHVLVRHGFADILARMRVIEGAPTKIMQALKLIGSEPDKPISQGQRLREALVELGPTFVKLGQILSTRPDIIGVPISKALQDLQDKVPTVPFDEIRKVFEKSMKRTIAEVFSQFNETPLAAASLSQVYRATLTTGEQVAVKIQRPDIAEIIQADVRLLRSIAEWIEENVPEFAWIDPLGLVNEFDRSIERELDFQIEGYVIERFRKNFGAVPSIVIPQSYPDASSARVLTMDFIDGVRIDSLHAYENRASTPKVVAELGCNALCMQIAEHGLFHADPHPGNILLTHQNQIAFLDFGMVGHLDSSDVLAMAEVLSAVVRLDPESCYKAILTFTVSGEVENEEAFHREVSEYISFEAESSVAGGHVGKALERIVTILNRNQLRLAPRFSLLIKALATIETTGRKLDPDLDMIPILRPYIEHIVAERLSPARLMREFRRDAINTLMLGRDLPEDIRKIVHQLGKGRFKVQVNHEDLESAAEHIDRASNRVTLGLITSAIIVGSSLLVRAGQPGNTLGLVGFSIAGILGFGLILSILRSRKF